MPTLAIKADVPPYPEGAELTVDEFFEWFAENATFEVDGDFLTGKIGGIRPTTDSGIFIIGRDIEVWDGDKSKYVTTTSVPIGAAIPWFSAAAIIPANYLLCDGSTVLRTEYPELFEVLGITWNKAGDDDSVFRLPDLRGRLVLGAGDGEYKHITGTLQPRTVGDYPGQHWPKNQAPWPGAPKVGVNRFIGTTGIKAATNTATAEMTQPAAVAQWLIRYR
jgi:microcystin-dependent protein